jgi:DNA polymerase III subunit epsilon
MPRYLILDTETSGLPLRAKKGEPPIPADAPGQPRLASFAMIATNPDLTVDEDATFCTLVCPDGWVMDPGATAVNGLTNERLTAEGLPVRHVLSIYDDMVRAGWVVVAHNAQFDTKVMRGELRRAGMDDLFEQTLNICTMKACRDIVKMPPSNAMMATGRRGFKGPKLIEAYRHFYERDFDGAHEAFADAYACLDVFRALMKIGAVPEPSILYASSRQD